MEIRRLRETDWETYRSIRLEALRLAPEAFGSDVDEQSSLPTEYWAARLAGGEDSLVLGAFWEGQVVGTAAFSRERRRKVRHKGTITGVYVAPAFRGRGVGRALLTALLGEVRTMQGLEQVTLCVVTENDPARELYRNLGFEVFGTEPRALKVGERYLDEAYMVLLLNQ
ncbi:MAG TPA: GNAT family N-acetyltransferase [Symbiobacteriaceae bacterium]|nr:GNAT family N-acetyltransferase [Symbiobacteriaceae bacterium]